MDYKFSTCLQITGEKTKLKGYQKITRSNNFYFKKVYIRVIILNHTTFKVQFPFPLLQVIRQI